MRRWRGQPREMWARITSIEWQGAVLYIDVKVRLGRDELHERWWSVGQMASLLERGFVPSTTMWAFTVTENGEVTGIGKPR